MLPFDTIPTISETAARLLLGALLGGLIGIERQTHGRAAGIRTHMIVSTASVLIMLVSMYYYQIDSLSGDALRIDPARVAAGAITGVGFLGAGVVVKMGVNIQGLTTAASIWMVSAIGLSVGSGMYAAGIFSFSITFISLVFFRWLERRLPRLVFRSITVTASYEADITLIEKSVESLHKAKIHSVDYQRDNISREFVCKASVSFDHRTSPHQVLTALSSLEGVKSVSVKSL